VGVCYFHAAKLGNSFEFVGVWWDWGYGSSFLGMTKVVVSCGMWDVGCDSSFLGMTKVNRVHCCCHTIVGIACFRVGGYARDAIPRSSE
jgi:hypothetical protein